MGKRIYYTWQNKIDQNESEIAFEHHLRRMKEADIDFPLYGDQQAGISSINPKKIFTFSIAALLVFLTAVFIWFDSSKKNTFFPVEKKYSEVSSPRGSKTKLVLPDSTIVWLNAGSKLTYNEQFGIANRNTTLVGEAYFDVKHSTMPFTIHANDIQIKVLGTAFNVRAYPDEKTTETSLIRGRVEITLDKKPGRQFILEPNEKLIVANEVPEIKMKIQSRDPLVVLKGLTRMNDSSFVETSWVHNELSFQDESFNEVAKKMEKWYGVAIEFKDKQLTSERLSGTFTYETIQEALNALQYSTKFHYYIKGNLITITQ